MTKPEIRMNDETRMTKHDASSGFVIRHSFGFRISDFGFSK